MNAQLNPHELLYEEKKKKKESLKSWEKNSETFYLNYRQYMSIPHIGISED